MTKYINFLSSNVALQGNKIAIPFECPTDRTVFGGYVTQYKYTYSYWPIYCSTKSNFDAQYDSAEITRLNREIAFSIDNGIDSAELLFIVPFFTCDTLVSISMSAYDDGTNSYIAIPGEITFVALANDMPSLKLKGVKRNDEGIISLSGTITETGIFKPKNRDEIDKSSQQWENYCKAIVDSFDLDTVPKPHFAWYSDLRKDFNPATSVQDSFVLGTGQWFTEWYPRDFEVTIEDSALIEQISPERNNYFTVALTYTNNPAPNGIYKFNADGSDAARLTNVTLLAAEIASFQIKRRAIKAHMLEKDEKLGTYSTGAGMFNHGAEVGVDAGANEVIYDVEGSFRVNSNMITSNGVTSTLAFSNLRYKYGQSGTIDMRVYNGWKGRTYFTLANGEILIETYNLCSDWSDLLTSDTNSALGSKLYIGIDQGTGKGNIIWTADLSSGTIITHIKTEIYLDTGLNTEKGHSIALYDTHVPDGASDPSNKPSIGFMDHEHNALASITYENGELVSSVPLKYSKEPTDGSGVYPPSSITLITKAGGKNIQLVGNFSYEFVD